MPTFDTPEPINATVTTTSGAIRVEADERTDTTVEVRPSDPGSAADAEAAEQTYVDFSHNNLVVKTPKKQRHRFFGPSARVDVFVTLPSGSGLDITSGSANQDYAGDFGTVRVNAASGDVRLSRTRQLTAHTASGNMSAEHVEGHTDINTASGDVRVAEVDGTAVVKTASGDVVVGSATGKAHLTTASGSITVGQLLGAASATTASGNIRFNEIIRGSLSCEAASGGIDIALRHGTAAWLDLSSTSGNVSNDLDPADGPAETDETAELRARTISGDILIRRT